MPIRRRFLDATSSTAQSCFLAIVFALTLSACEGGVVVTPSGVPESLAARAPVSAELWQEEAPFAGPGVVQYSCAAGPWAPAYDLVVIAGTTVELDSVTIRMLDGTHLGGPMIAFPRPQLTDDFGTTVIVAGGSRRFRFHPRFPCDVTAYGVAADLGFVDGSGGRHDLTVSRSLR
jgi:hypothetical protein